MRQRRQGKRSSATGTDADDGSASDRKDHDDDARHNVVNGGGGGGGGGATTYVKPSDDDDAGASRGRQRWGSNTSLVFGAALLIRLVLLVYGEWQDATMAVKYTDVDYVVFSDAAALVAQGQSPFGRTTYRYTPLLAWLMLPNVTVHYAFGKLVFVLADLAIAVLIQAILTIREVKPRTATWCAAVWLFHPLSINVSTRGNADSLVCLMVLLTLYLAITRKDIACAFMFGLAVHFKVYPVIYALPLYFFFDDHYEGVAADASAAKSSSSSRRWMSALAAMFSCRRLRFAFISASTFFALGGLCYYLYGYEFLYETYLHHIVRADTRHNFSVYFYNLYLVFDSPDMRTTMSRAAFLPQLACCIVFGLRFYRDLPLALFLQTIAFVAFNKVCTAQYFLWFLCLLPLLLPQSKLRFKDGWLPLIVAWFGAEFFWLAWGYKLEFLCENVFLQMWGAGIVFFLANIAVLAQVLRHHVVVPVFVPRQGPQVCSVPAYYAKATKVSS